MTFLRFLSTIVTPAKAGVQLRSLKFIGQGLDSRLRGNDKALEWKGPLE